jgi:hypothetical protein
MQRLLWAGHISTLIESNIYTYSVDKVGKLQNLRG